VESNNFTETYKRFYFKDFQALIVRKTNSFSRFGIIRAVEICVVLILLILSASGHHRVLTVCMSMILVWAVIALAIHLKRGPTCSCHLKMPLAVHELPSVCRLKYAGQVIELLTPYIRKFQGSLTVEEIKSRIRDGFSAASPAQPPFPDIVPPYRKLKECSGFVHMLMFALLLLDAAATLLWLYYDLPIVQALDMIFGSASFIFVIAALVKQAGASLPRMIKGLVFAVLAVDVYLCFVIYVSNVARLVRLQAHKGGVMNQYDLASQMAIIMKPASSPLLARAIFYYVFAAAIIGLWGLAAVIIHRSRMKKPAPVSADSSNLAAGHRDNEEL
jgi:hypothetical protein